MIISKLSLHNFGLYAGENVIEIGNNCKGKPVTLIGGMNGRGKTTILEAILLALYGRRSFAFLESKLSYPSYLKKFVNKSDGSLITRIELTFILDFDDYSDKIKLKRQWDIDVKGKTDQLYVYKNDKYDKYLSENWGIYIEDILPSAISRFFFFDGEKISDIAVENTDSQMKDSIKTLLGIDTIDRLIVDLKRVIATKREKYNLQDSDSRIEVLTKKKEALVEKAEEIDQRIKNLFSTQEQLRIKLEEKELEFIRIGGSLANNRAELIEKKASLKSKLNEIYGELLEFVSGELPLLLVSPLLQDIKVASKFEQDNKIKKYASKTVSRFLSELRKDLEGIQEACAVINTYELNFQKSVKLDEASLYDLSEIAQAQVNYLINSALKEKPEKINKLLVTRDEIQKKLDEIDSYLTIDIDQELTSDVFHTIKNYTAKIAELEGKIQVFNFELHQIETEKDLLDRELSRLIEEVLNNLEEKDDSARIVKYANLSIDLMEKYKLALQKQKTTHLASVMSECFSNIIGKEALISRVVIAPETLEFIYYDGNGEQILKSQLSAGEKQLLVIAMLWALAKCSRKRLPVIIDTPLGRLDSSHRSRFLARYLPNASEQVIVLSTDEEINGKYLNLIKPYVCKEYLLNFNHETQSTKIIDGYFKDGDRNK